jgi:hypothetical protein
MTSKLNPTPKLAPKPLVKKAVKVNKVQKVEGLNTCIEHQNPCINSDEAGICKSRIQPCCKPIIKKCQGCERTREYGEELYCKSYMWPALIWRRGPCAMATHIAKEKVKEQKINPLKASKKAKKKVM